MASLEPNLLLEVVEGGSSLISMNGHVWVVSGRDGITVPRCKSGLESVLPPMDCHVPIGSEKHSSVALGVQEEGAGASAPFGIPTMQQMVRDFKVKLEDEGSGEEQELFGNSANFAKQYLDRPVDLEAVFTIVPRSASSRLRGGILVAPLLYDEEGNKW